MSRPPVLRKQGDLERNFEESFARLVRANESYDEGHFAEAITIASIVYVFVHEGGRRIPSLLSLLGRKDAMRFIDTAYEMNPANLLALETPLIITHVKADDIELIPIKDTFIGNLTPMAFSKWWEKAVLRDAERRLYSRKNLIHFFRHTLGGGHAGKNYESQDTLDSDAFEKLRNVYARAMKFEVNGVEVTPRYGPDYISVRQIGWELEQTLRNSCHDLIVKDSVSGPNFRPTSTG